MIVRPPSCRVSSDRSTASPPADALKADQARPNPHHQESNHVAQTGRVATPISGPAGPETATAAGGDRAALLLDRVLAGGPDRADRLTHRAVLEARAGARTP